MDETKEKTKQINHFIAFEYNIKSKVSRVFSHKKDHTSTINECLCVKRFFLIEKKNSRRRRRKKNEESEDITFFSLLSMMTRKHYSKHASVLEPCILYMAQERNRHDVLEKFNVPFLSLSGLVATLCRDIGIYRNWKTPFT